MSPRSTPGLSPAKAVKRPSLPRQQVFRIESASDPRQNCLAYIPAVHKPDAPVFVSVHGLSINSEEHATLFAPYCEKYGVFMIAPTFDKEHFPDFQRLGRQGLGLRADEALDAVIKEFRAATKTEPAPIHLFGFSGGGQFAHRYAMAHPDHVARVVIAAAGWYTFPDRGEKFPYGLRTIRTIPDLSFDPERFLRVPMTVIVGDQDVQTEHLRITDRVNRQQGVNRLERARNWVGAMQAAARIYRLEPRVTLQTLPGGEHTFGLLMRTSALGDRVFAAMFGAPPAYKNGVHSA